MKYAVTGSTGSLGTLVIDSLSKLGVPATSLVAIARNPEKARKYEERGIEVKIADYNQPETLEKAFSGMDKVLFISGSELNNRVGQHKNVVNALKKAGVGMVAYTSLFHAHSSAIPMAADHIATEKLIMESGISHVFLRNNWYTENHVKDLEMAAKQGLIRSAVGDGVICSASRRDYAEAAARVLVNDKTTHTILELRGEPWTYHDLAAAVSQILGKEVRYTPVKPEEQRETLKSFGMAEEVAGFIVSLEVAISKGALDGTENDLEQILGRKPDSLKQGLEAAVKK